MVYKWYYKVIITCIHLTLRLLHLGEAISKTLNNKEKTSDATATRFCVLQNKHVMGASDVNSESPFTKFPRIQLTHWPDDTTCTSHTRSLFTLQYF